MSDLWILAGGGAAAAAIGWLLHRRALRRRAACRRRFAALLEERRPEVTVGEDGSGRWWLERRGEPLAEIDGRALTRAAASGSAAADRLFLTVADAARHGPRPLAGRLDLKRHGARILPRLADDGLPLLALEPAARFAAPGAAGLETIYLVDGEPRPAYVTGEHLAGAGIDERDLHGVALAVLRQRFEEDAARAALAGGAATALQPADGCGGSRLLLLPEALRGDERLFACAPSPDLLLLASERDALARALAGRPEPEPPLPPAVFSVTANGLTMEG